MTLSLPEVPEYFNPVPGFISGSDVHLTILPDRTANTYFRSVEETTAFLEWYIHWHSFSINNDIGIHTGCEQAISIDHIGFHALRPELFIYIHRLPADMTRNFFTGKCAEIK